MKRSIALGFLLSLNIAYGAQDSRYEYRGPFFINRFTSSANRCYEFSPEYEKRNGGKPVSNTLCDNDRKVHYDFVEEFDDHDNSTGVASCYKTTQGSIIRKMDDETECEKEHPVHYQYARSSWDGSGPYACYKYTPKNLFLNRGSPVEATECEKQHPSHYKFGMSGNGGMECFKYSFDGKRISDAVSDSLCDSKFVWGLSRSGEKLCYEYSSDDKIQNNGEPVSESKCKPTQKEQLPTTKVNVKESVQRREGVQKSGQQKGFR